LADELGSGVRRLHYYVPRYSGKEPELIDGDVFRIVVPLDEGYSYDAGTASKQLVNNLKGNGCTINCTNDCTIIEREILKYLANNPEATQTQIASNIGKSLRTVKSIMASLKNKGILKREGTNKTGYWIV
jgi:ATP-dependent DNA helicase RecG